MIDRVHRELTDADVSRLATTYHAWRGDRRSLPPAQPGSAAASLRLPLGEGGGEGYVDQPGFCKSATLEEIRQHGHVLTPGRYVGAEAAAEDDEPFGERMQRLTATLRQQIAGTRQLDEAIADSLERLGFGS
jgi:type I restriction enzyme M protein